MELFQPDFVLFETADYVLNDNYFPSERYAQEFQPRLKDIKTTDGGSWKEPLDINLQEKNLFIDISLKREDIDYVYLRTKEKLFDFHLGEEEAYLTIPKEDYEESILYLIKDGVLYRKNL